MNISLVIVISVCLLSHSVISVEIYCTKGKWSPSKKRCEQPSAIDYYNDYSCTVTKLAAGALVAIGAATVFLPVAGFTAAGVTAGSLAAGVQSMIGSVAAGSAFAGLQSAGVVGYTAATKIAIAVGGSAVAYVTPVGCDTKPKD